MKKKPNYQVLFSMGIILVGVGVVFMSSVKAVFGGAFIGVGIAFMIIGGKNKDKWGKK